MKVRTVIFCGLIMAVGLVGCEPDRGEIIVETVVGDEVFVDGADEAAGEPGEPIEVQPGQREVTVALEDQTTDRVAVDVGAGETETVEIPWDAVPVADRREVAFPVPEEALRDDDSMIDELSEEASEQLGQDIELQPTQEAFPPDAFDQFAEVRRGDETPAGRPLVVERAEAMVGDLGFQFESGDRIFALDGEPVEDTDEIIDALNGVATGEGPRSVTLLRDGRKWSLDYSAEPLSETDGGALPGGPGQGTQPADDGE